MFEDDFCEDCGEHICSCDCDEYDLWGDEFDDLEWIEDDVDDEEEQ